MLLVLLVFGTARRVARPKFFDFGSSLINKLRWQTDTRVIDAGCSTSCENKQVTTDLQELRPKAVAISMISFAPFNFNFFRKIPFPLFIDPEERNSASMFDQLSAKNDIGVPQGVLRIRARAETRMNGMLKAKKQNHKQSKMADFHSWSAFVLSQVISCRNAAPRWLYCDFSSALSSAKVLPIPGK